MSSLVQFLSDLRGLGITLSLKGDRLGCNAPKNAVTPEIRTQLADRKAEIMAFLQNTKAWAAVSERTESASGELPLSRSQRRVWFLGQLDAKNPAYNIGMPFWLTGTLNRDALERSLRAMVDRHEALRTGFFQRDGQPFAQLVDAASWKMAFVDLSSLDTDEAEREAVRLAYSEIRWPFDLEQPPLFRATLILLSPDRYLLVMAVQHIVADAWSYGVLSRELMELYGAFAAGQPSHLAKPACQFRDYVKWEQEVGEKIADQEMTYWLERLRGELPILELPEDRRRPATQTLIGRNLAIGIDAALADRIRELSRETGTTVFMVLLAAFQTLLFRYTGIEDIVVGSNTSNRPKEEFSTQIGFFINTLVLRTDFRGDPSFIELLRRVRETAVGAYAHQNVPLDRLVESLHLERRLSHTPLVQVMFTLQNVPLPDLRLPKLSVKLAQIDPGIARADIGVMIWPEDRGFRCEFEYSTDLFDEGTIQQMQRHYVRLLQMVAADPKRKVNALPLLSQAEVKLITVDWNLTEAPRGEYKTVPEWFRAQAAATPGATAVLADGLGLTYAELDRRSDALAGILRSKGVRREVVAGLYVNRGINMIVGLLAILKAGGAYLPLDPAFPAERIAFLLKDAGAALILTETAIQDTLPDTTASLLCLDRPLPPVDTMKMDEQPHAADLAYLIYTSGSTGDPKGTEVTHGSLVNLLSSMLREPGLSREDTLVAVTTLSFDIAALEIFGPLVCGARLALASREQTIDPLALAELLEKVEATVLQATPSTWRMLVESGWFGKSGLRMWCGGEALSTELAGSLLERGRELWNLYGPTETTIWSAAHRVLSGEDPILIGRPIRNTRMYILDSERQPVPIGVAGELYIAGDGVARGYWKRPDLTEARFLPEPFAAQGNGRMYRTGDSARYRRDGQIQVLGRTDHQIKLRGHRIELGEIEAVLERHPEVQQAVAALHGGGSGQQLIAYLRQPEKTETSALRAWLQQRIPEYMTPAVFISLPELPLTPNGKVDRKRLPAPESAVREGPAPAVAPRNRLEEHLAEIWADVLRLDRVGIQDNFFDLGGHSLLLIKVHARIRQEIDPELAVVDLFRHPTVESLAKALAAKSDGGKASPAGTVAKSAPRPEDHPLSRSQQRLWFLDQLDPGNAVYNIVLPVRLKGVLPFETMERSLKTLLHRHESLRISFREQDGIPYAKVENAENWKMEFADLSDRPEQEREAEILQYGRQETRRPFALDCGPLFRALLLRAGPEDHLLILVVHHIIFDGWSMGVLAQELAAVYEALSAGRAPALPPLRHQFRDYVSWEQRQSGDGNEHLLYWKKQLGGELPLLELPTDYRRPPMQSFRGGRVWAEIPSTLIDRLQRVSRQQNATLFMVLFAAYNVLLMRYSRQQDILVGTPTAGRLRSEFEGLIGFFVNNLVLRTDLTGDPSFAELVGRVRITALEAFEHQSVPFDQLVEELQPDRGLDRGPIFQVLFTLQNTPQTKTMLAGLESIPVELPAAQARFDISVEIFLLEGVYICNFEYNTDLFEEATIRRMLQHYLRLLEAVAADPARKLSALPLLSETERKLILEDWNLTEGPRVEYETVIEWFSAQAAKTPEAIAVVAGDGALTYAELDRHSGALAAVLRARGVEREVVVGLYVTRGLRMIVGLLAILKAGGAYLPLDPAFPAQRIEFLIKDAGTPLILTETGIRSTLPEMAGSLLCIDEALPAADPAPIEAAPIDGPPRTGDLAYMIYTSGSTGNPKGTEVTHGALVNLLASMLREPGLSQHDTLVAVTTLSFDIAGLEIWGPLVSGARLVLASREQAVDPLALAELLEEVDGTVLQATPSTWRMLVESGWLGKSCLRMWCGGEALPSELADSLLERGRELWNLYGPTETTIWSAVHRVTSGEDPILIGRPIASTRMYILDSQGQPVPIGVAGELYIGGAGVARGYWKRPDLTEARFVPEAFAGRTNNRMYRTGDLARYRRDGQIQLLGRADQQIKLRGHRIELGEIEAVLERHPDVEQAVVVLFGEGSGQQLAAYLKQAEKTDQMQLKAWLQERVPDYMAPAIFVSLRQLPLTPNGKVDRKRLPPPEEIARERSTAAVAPRTRMEQILVEIWSEVLRVAKVGINDNFFDLGGYSLLLIKVHARLRREVDAELPVVDLFRYPTIEALAGSLDRRRQAAAIAEGALS